MSRRGQSLFSKLVRKLVAPTHMRGRPQEGLSLETRGYKPLVEVNTPETARVPKSLHEQYNHDVACLRFKTEKDLREQRAAGRLKVLSCPCRRYCKFFPETLQYACGITLLEAHRIKDKT